MNFCRKSLKIPNGVIRVIKSKKNRQHIYKKKKYKQRSTKHTNKTKDRVTRTPLKSRDELRCPGRVSCHSQDVKDTVMASVCPIYPGTE